MSNKTRFTNNENEVIKSACSGEVGLSRLTLFRDAFLQIPLNTKEQADLKAYILDTPVFSILKKMMTPQLVKGSPTPVGPYAEHQIEFDFIEKTATEMKAIVIAKRYIDNMMDEDNLLDTSKIKEGKNLLLSELLPSQAVEEDCMDATDIELLETAIKLKARDNIISFVSRVVLGLYGMSMQKEQSPEEKKERLQKDSSR